MRKGKTNLRARSHTLRGCVDWNRIMPSAFPLNSVTPCVGVWIETKDKALRDYYKWVTPCVGVWIETVLSLRILSITNVTPCVGVWIET